MANQNALSDDNKNKSIIGESQTKPGETRRVKVTDEGALVVTTIGGGGGSASVWHNGATNPSEDTGDDGDYYLNTVSGDVYEKKSGVWENVGNIKGPQGSKGEPGYPTEEQWNALVARVDDLEQRVTILEGGGA